MKIDKRRGPAPNKLSKTDAAYLAGFIDGEGCVAISRKTDPTMRAGYGYRLYLAASNTNRPIIDYVRRITGVGFIYNMNRPSKRHKQAYSWQVWSQQARGVLEQILPFLRIKRKRALIAIKFASTFTQCFGKTGLPSNVANAQKAVFARMKRLNKRGQ